MDNKPIPSTSTVKPSFAFVSGTFLPPTPTTTGLPSITTPHTTHFPASDTDSSSEGKEITSRTATPKSASCLTPVEESCDITKETPTPETIASSEPVEETAEHTHDSFRQKVSEQTTQYSTYGGACYWPEPETSKPIEATSNPSFSRKSFTQTKSEGLSFYGSRLPSVWDKACLQYIIPEIEPDFRSQFDINTYYKKLVENKVISISDSLELQKIEEVYPGEKTNLLLSFLFRQAAQNDYRPFFRLCQLLERDNHPLVNCIQEKYEEYLRNSQSRWNSGEPITTLASTFETTTVRDSLSSSEIIDARIHSFDFTPDVINSLKKHWKQLALLMGIPRHLVTIGLTNPSDYDLCHSTMCRSNEIMGSAVPRTWPIFQTRVLYYIGDASEQQAIIRHINRAVCERIAEASRSTLSRPTENLRDEVITPPRIENPPIPTILKPEFDQKSCDICSDPYNKNTNAPCILENICTHIMCKNCFLKLMAKKTTEHCPVCRASFRYEDIRKIEATSKHCAQPS